MFNELKETIQRNDKEVMEKNSIEDLSIRVTAAEEKIEEI